MDSREIDVVGIILNFPVKLVAYPDIGVTMNIVVIDVPDRWGILLSKKWAASLGGSIQMHWTYAMIPASEDAHVKLYREKERKYHVEDPDELWRMSFDGAFSKTRKGSGIVLTSPSKKNSIFFTD